MILRQHRLAWQPQALAPATIKSWLKETDSLTSRLQKRYADFTLQQLSQGLAHAHRDEWHILKLKPNQLVHSREVLLQGGCEAVIYAHTVVALKHLRGEWYWLKKLGSKPLGTYLFAKPKIKRGPLHYKRLAPWHPLAKKVYAHTQATDNPKSSAWARRSLFSLNGVAILVTEVMLAPLSRRTNEY